MNIATFRDLAETYGSDLARWPADRLAAATGLLRSDPLANEILREQADVDAWLAAADVEVSDARADRVAAAIAARLDTSVPLTGTPPAARSSAAMPRPLWSAGFLMMMGLIGVLAGATTAPAGVENQAYSSLTHVSVINSTGSYADTYFVAGSR